MLLAFPAIETDPDAFLQSLCRGNNPPHLLQKGQGRFILREVDGFSFVDVKVIVFVDYITKCHIINEEYGAKFLRQL